MKVPQLLDPKSLATGDTKEKQVILYVSLIFNAFQAELEKRRRTLFARFGDSSCSLCSQLLVSPRLRPSPSASSSSSPRRRTPP